MPNCDFYAAGEDFNDLLSFVFDTLPVRVFESYAHFDTHLEEFKTIEDILRRYPLWQEVKDGQLLLQLWPINASKNVSFQKINLKIKDHSFRYQIQGWGLIQLYLGYTDHKKKKILCSHTNHNSEKRALKWHDPIRDTNSPSDWDWKEVNSVSATLNRYIKKLAVDKKGSHLILSGAKDFMNKEYEMAFF